ncbi:MAG TPA: glycoside hydrolase family 172 protein [Vicinamibacteria bacterium]|nr:glycoside hydrolase family 172 protein [Vicinamibacteria bacterium]
MKFTRAAGGQLSLGSFEEMDVEEASRTLPSAVAVTFADLARSKPPERPDPPPSLSRLPRPAAGPPPEGLSRIHLAREGRLRRQSSWDRSGRYSERIRIPPGDLAVLARIHGAGIIRHIWLTLWTDEPAYLRKMVLRAYWDGESNPSVESPVGDFFGVGHAEVSNYWSQPLSMVTGGPRLIDNRPAMSCFFPMPFTDGAWITLENQGSESVRAVHYHVDYEELGSQRPDALRFHALWRRQWPEETEHEVDELSMLSPNRDYLILDAEGEGHYVGCTVSVDSANQSRDFSWFGEGDDFCWIDGEMEPSIIGTRTEDYFCASRDEESLDVRPYHGLSYSDDSGGSSKWTMYRFHIDAPISFRKSIRYVAERDANLRGSDYSSVAYWYQSAPHKSFPPLLSVEGRLPRGAELEPSSSGLEGLVERGNGCYSSSIEKIENLV